LLSWNARNEIVDEIARRARAATQRFYDIDVLRGLSLLAAIASILSSVRMSASLQVICMSLNSPHACN
jgi:hypothetical protein